jgi:hypothetical protein
MASLQDNEFPVPDNADGGIRSLHITKIVKAEIALQTLKLA